MNYVLFDDDNRINLLPLVFTRPVCDMRIGILTIREKWEHYLKTSVSFYTQNYLQKKYPHSFTDDTLFINGSVLPDKKLFRSLSNLAFGDQLILDDELIAFRIGGADIESIIKTKCLKTVRYDSTIFQIKNTWDIFSKNEEALKNDFELLTKGRNSSGLSDTNFVMGNRDDIFLEEGAKVEFAFLNTQSGPIYIGKDAEVMEGSKIRGPFALCDHSQLKLDAKIYGATTIGPHCKVGGEINNSVFFGYSNKAHDGFLGNAAVGEWVNLGADTNNSNLKNTYDQVKLWSYAEKRFIKTGLQFCGLVMGDHSKTGINTMFNTGTVIGVSCNLFGSGYQRNFIPSYSWGSPLKMLTYDLEKSLQVAKAVMARRGLDFNQIEQDILRHVYHMTRN